MGRKVLFTICISFLVACGKQDVQEIIPQPIPPGTRPAILYHNQVYRKSHEDTVKALPSDYNETEDVVLGNQEKVSTPSLECYTAGFDEDIVGASIYTNDNEELIIRMNDMETYYVFILED